MCFFVIYREFVTRSHVDFVTYLDVSSRYRVAKTHRIPEVADHS